MPFPSELLSSLRLAPGAVDLNRLDPRDSLGYDGDKGSAEEALAGLGVRLADAQERLFAHRGDAAAPRVLLVLQGMDTSGKGGVIEKAVGLVNPQGVRITSFKAPTAEELEHDFLWRVRKAVPEPGYLGVFDRSHYEDVLIGRVRGLADAEEIERRYAAIADFEGELAASGVRIVKCMLHISAETQKERLLARLDDPAKHWKFNPADIDERALWAEYRSAYQVALERTSTATAPWYVVPSDRKWLRNLAVAQLLLEALESFELEWPPADFDPVEQRRRLLEEDPIS
ncbi:PPK2 family polyphosphate kinase [Nocardioides dubius]|uniref:Polyphosphate kinase-2-related domain-containing protein n=1 Tax=Nocardioides dubius TaxID=317019 RepID=A0ABN1U1M2_9ACTN